MTKEELQKFISEATTQEAKDLARAELQKLELVEQAAQGDSLANTLLVLKDAVDAFKGKQPQPAQGGGVSKDEIDKMLKNYLSKGRIGYDDLDAELRAKLSGNVKVQLNLITPQLNTLISSKLTLEQIEKSLFQKLLSDLKARNNVYLYGGAGTGKTYLAGQLADFLNWRYIEVNCNQFTSPLDLIGGQTITGYQKGKLEMAWTNMDEKGNSFAGAVLCLDELPKLDPNTAGLLNSALAKVKDITPTKIPTIFNGKGQAIEMKNIFIIATGNVRLNETSVEYEANFKQDLSLQDRFAGSCYEVFPDYANEFYVTMKGLAFIWIYMTKLREAIIEERLTGQAFVSYRILNSMRDTYIVYRTPEDQFISEGVAITSPKTLRQSLDSFLNLFKPNQIDLLKQKTNYDEFIKTIEQKDRMPLTALDTEEELRVAQDMIRVHQAYVASKTV